MEKDYLIKKWLAGKLTEDERKAFETMDDYELHKAIVEEAPRFKASHFNEVPEYTTLESRLSTPKASSRPTWTKALAIAASLLIIGFVSYITLFDSLGVTTVKTMAAEKTTITLPDASEVTLNAASEMSYKAKSWDDERSLNLQGEAYFKVAKGKVFDVNTSEGVVTVVGTEFNVKQRASYFEVQCFEGKVKVVSNRIERKVNEELIAGETLRIYNGNLQLDQTSNNLPRWTLNISDFKATPFKEVVAEMERQYNLSISYDTSLSERLFTGAFVHDNLENALESIAIPQNLTYEIESSNKVRLTLGER